MVLVFQNQQLNLCGSDGLSRLRFCSDWAQGSVAPSWFWYRSGMLTFSRFWSGSSEHPGVLFIRTGSVQVSWFCCSDLVQFVSRNRVGLLA